MSNSDLTISSNPHDRTSFFYNSFSKVYSEYEVITLVVLGVLALLMACVALYGYFLNPAWIIGAHVLTSTTFFTCTTAALLVIMKHYQNKNHRPNDCSQRQRESTLESTIVSIDQFRKPDNIPPKVEVVRQMPDQALEQIFGNPGKVEEEILEISLCNFKSTIKNWMEQLHGSYCFGKFKGGEPFAAIKYQTLVGVKGLIVLYETKCSWETYVYSTESGKPTLWLDTSFGHPKDVAFLADLVQNKKSGEFELYPS